MSVRLVGSSAAAARRKSWRRSHFSSRHSNRMKSHLVFLTFILLCSYTQAVPQPQYGKFFYSKVFVSNPKKEALEPCSDWTKMREILLKALRVPLTWILVFFFFTVLCVFLLKKQASKARLSTWKSMLLPGKRGQKLSISVLHVIFWGHQTKHWTGFFIIRNYSCILYM